MRLVLLILLLAAPAWGQDEVRVTVESTPAGARVFDRSHTPGSDRGFLGLTPLEFSAPRSMGQPLYFERDGYQTLRAELEPGQARLSVALQPASPAAWVAHAFRYQPLTAVPVALALLGLAGMAAAFLQRRYRRLQQRLSEAEEKDPELVGRVLGQYRVTGLIGSGSSGTVVRAEHVEYGDVYALKLLAPERVDAEALERFQREVTVGLDLRHPNVTRVFAYGDYRGAPWLVMEHLQGETLRERLRRGPLPVKQAVDVARQVARGLAAAHQRGVVHRDLKPDNLMVLRDGTVKIMDFGVARVLDSRQITATGTALGTPHYMSPEHLRAREMDGRSDLYSLGVILFECLTGEVPFGGLDTYAVLAAHLSEDPPPPSELCGSVPEWLDDLVLRLLSKDPTCRPASAAALEEELR